MAKAADWGSIMTAYCIQRLDLSPPYRALIAPTAFQQIQLIRENESIALVPYSSDVHSTVVLAEMRQLWTFIGMASQAS